MKIKFMRLFLVFTVLALSSCSTLKTDSDAPPPSVEKFISENGDDFINYDVSDTTELGNYNHHQLSYDIYEDIETVWADYKNTEPDNAFGGRIIDFGVVFNPEDLKLYKASDSFIPHFSVGQVFILDLELMGFYNIPVAFKVSRIDDEGKVMEFIYLKNNVSNGLQRIYFKSAYDEEGVPVTHIDHISFFSSGHKFRDDVLYPPFHNQTVRDFHENIFRINRLNGAICKM